MDDPKLSRDLAELAAKNISDRQNIWPRVQTRISEQAGPRQVREKTRLWLAAAVLLAALGLVTVFVPTVRAGFIELIENIGGITFNLTADYPGEDGPVTVVPSETLPLTEVLSDHDFYFPAWAPEGYALDTDVQVTRIGWETDQPLIVLTWRGPDARPITLAVKPITEEIVGLTEIETVLEDGQEFALWHGGWNYDTKTWDENISVQTLSWAVDGLSYDLQADASIPSEWLVQMAVSSLP